MKQFRLLTLLALLMTAATGAWAQDTYKVSMKDGVKDADKWTITPTEATTTGILENTEVTLQYNGRLKVKGVKATSDAGAPAAPTGNIVDLSTLTADYEAKDGDVLTGETTSYKVTIAAGATVTLDGATISGGNYCIKCAGDATIILKDGSTNTLTSTSAAYPALSIGDANTTLTIQGSTGVLNVTSGNYCAGIGGGYKNTNSTCGNIRIEGGVITAQGGKSGAGIGTDCGKATCGDIIITGGTITAKGGTGAAGIGTGKGEGLKSSVCGDITIANTVTKVTATAGEYASYSIGKGNGGEAATCGTVTIGGTKYWENNAAVGDGATYLAQSPLIYDPTAPAAAAFAADEYNEASWDDTNKKVVFEKKKATTTPVAVADATTDVTWDAGWYTVSGTVTITGNVTLGADTHLILQDGATLTINGQLKANKKNLYIYGQKKGDGKLNVTNNSGTAIICNKHIDIHGGEVTASAAGDLIMGLSTGYLAVYGGKLTATSGGNIGIAFSNTIDVYGGEVVATSNATSSSVSWYGIKSSSSSDSKILTVYGGKVTATGNGVSDVVSNYGSGFSCYVKSGTSGIKFYFSDNGTDWDAGTNYSSATSVGSKTDDAATKKRYAKAE